MNTFFQRTIKQRISCSGVGLHSGVSVSMTLCPAVPNTGIIFNRIDLELEVASIEANWKNIHSGILCTTLANQEGQTVGTIEHLMAALCGCGIDNVVIDLNGPEVPIMDGSAAPFISLIECAGIIEQDFPRKYIRVRKHVFVSDGSGSMHLRPSDNLRINFEIDFESNAVAHQEYLSNVTEKSFKKDLGGARTFGFVDQIEAMRELGYGRGGSLDNAVIVDGDRILNEGGLRFSDEFVRHKVLDCLGDMYLAGGPILGEITGIRSGHSLSHKLLRSLLCDETAWCFGTNDDFLINDVLEGDTQLIPPIAATA